MLPLKQKIFILAIVILAYNSAIAQGKKKLPDFAISPGVIFQRQTLGEFNVLIGRYEYERGWQSFQGVRLGAESNFKNGTDQIAGFKIGVEESGTLLCARATALTYFHNDNIQFRLLPELGICIGGFVNLTYGYNFNLSKVDINGISNHRVCLSINLNKALIKDSFDSYL